MKQHTQRDRGTLFELLIVAYLENEPMYSRLYDEIWKLSDVPAEYNIPKKDTGVDLVAKKRETGELVAIQCKYYSADTVIRKSHIDSFLNEVGKSYYSEGIIVTTTDKWSTNADEALKFRNKTIARVSLANLQESKIDWSAYSFSSPKQVKLQRKKTPRPHQVPAIKAVIEGFKNADRGKLIMAPGTGKTYTSMAIAEKMAAEKNGVFKVLYLVPSIQLLSQTLRSWNADISFKMDSIAVCSDRKVTKEKGENELEDIAAADIGYPATTNTEKLLEYQDRIERSTDQGDFLTVFSTYQSIDVIIEAQKNGFYNFDLVVCDEAHRTTGATELNKEASAFTKVHSDDNIKANKRLYQTATPRVYGEDAKKKAEEMSVLIADMSDPEIYGEEFYRIGFGDAIRKDILTDYKVMVLAVDEEVIARRFQQMLARESELEFDDVTKIIGCWNGLVKRKGNTNETLGQPMKRAIAFTGTIKDSKLITNMFSNVVDEYINEVNEQSDIFNIEIEHADGSMNALQKNEKISWLKADVPERTCRILSNARFLTEGVDVPDLDAVMFLKPRKSKIDIAQAVGRVMRKAPGKDYGYVILPIGIPAGVDPNTVLDNNEKYRVVWEVLNALRSLDERFDATINKLELNKKKPEQIQVIGVGDAPEDGLVIPKPEDEQLAWSLTDEDWSELERAIYGRIVRKVGNVRYWEDWSKDVAEIAQQHMMRIRVMLEDTNSEAYNEFKKFVTSLRHNINSSISDNQAIEMLAQHLITKPVFEALFDSYSFVHNNPVSKAMDSILSVLDEQGLVKEQEKLQEFYESVRIRAQGIDNLKAKQDIIIQLYDKFFKVGFKETTDRLGIVFTPVEVVDFIIHSVDEVLKKHFGKSISDEGVNVLDPFTGTGTFITRLLQSGLINKDDMFRKYTQELHANEIVLLSYYIAAINIEETFHGMLKDENDESEYVPFKGIVLTDTLESTEKEDTLDDEFFGDNDERLKRQIETPITVIIGNPPYSIGQTSANDNNQNIDYPRLTQKIDQTYARYTSGLNKKSLFDTYIKAFRWSTDRIGDTGVIAFITPNSIIDKPSHEGFRKVIHDEFNYIYSINLKGAVRGKIGEEAKLEGQSVFNILTGVAITLLVKDASNEHKIFYFDIGDYLSRKDKLEKLNILKSIANTEFQQVIPDVNNDWINQRDEQYSTFKEMDGEVFQTKAIGVTTNRDAWVYNYSKETVHLTSKSMIDNYNSEVERLSSIKDLKEKVSLINTKDDFVKWSRGLKKKLEQNQLIEHNPNSIIESSYRPFAKKWLYYDKNIVEYPGIYHSIFGKRNKVIYVAGGGARRDFSVLMVDLIPNLHLMENGRGYVLYNNDTSELFSDNSNINDHFCKKIRLNSEDVFYYVYGLLHSEEYRFKYNNDLRKASPRIPILKNKEKFVEIGRRLADLHINYEKVSAYDGIDIIYKSQTPSYKVQKMKHPKRGQLDSIVFNKDITIKSIPEKAYEYVVNGRPAIEWIIDQYQVKTDKKSGIIDDPNEYSDDEKYIFYLLLSVINVSVQTVDLVKSLPALEIEEFTYNQ
ncbi:DEAD/DEAH box helicase [Cytobacillus sp. Sa5YUA1]|uniref:DEAD/DEAH box helicase n=2 Tax=Cytobacillus stercorigallinarum TaxID=2762240 RepID=A0ABR8QNZ5_9BACI|nr:DEAD/DEAH box helicase [Cytobacillus stercorigallinarum]